jgi:hypothetical protein
MEVSSPQAAARMDLDRRHGAVHGKPRKRNVGHYDSKRGVY